MRKRITPYLFFLPSLVFIGAVIAYPTIYSWYISFHEYWPTKPGIETTFIGVTNYLNILSDSYFFHSLEVTLLIMVSALVLEFIVGLGIAVLLNRELVGEKLIRSVILMPMMVTPAVVAILWKIMLSPRVGVINFFLSSFGLPTQIWLGNPNYAPFAIVLIDFWQWTPFLILVFLAGLKSLPIPPFEAAIIDGASRWKIFTNLTIPMLKPVIFTGLLFRIIDTFKIFDLIWVLTQGGPSLSTETVSYYLYKQAFKFYNMGYSSALAIVLLFVTTFICTVYLRYFFEKE